MTNHLLGEEINHPLRSPCCLTTESGDIRTELERYPAPSLFAPFHHHLLVLAPIIDTTPQAYGFPCATNSNRTQFATALDFEAGIMMDYSKPAAVIRSSSTMMYEVYMGSPTADSLDLCSEVCDRRVLCRVAFVNFFLPFCCF